MGLLLVTDFAGCRVLSGKVPPCWAWVRAGPPRSSARERFNQRFRAICPYLHVLSAQNRVFGTNRAGEGRRFARRNPFRQPPPRIRGQPFFGSGKVNGESTVEDKGFRLVRGYT